MVQDNKIIIELDSKCRNCAAQ